MTPNEPQVQEYSIARKLQFTLVITVFILVLFTIVGEVVVRLTMTDASPPTPPFDTALKDERLGWKMTPAYAWSGELPDLAGNRYKVDLAYDANGFKAFGDINSLRPKVLFIGDSYTASVEVSNKNTFYNIVGDSLDIEVFAYGQAGYGTLQELLVFEDWVDRISPDLIMWQVCSNDFIDNHAPLEMQTGYKVGERRPYLNERGDIVYRCPKTFWQKVTQNIMFYKWLTDRWQATIVKVSGQEAQAGEYFISTEERAYAPFDESVTVTELIVERLVRSANGRKVIGYTADSYKPQLYQWVRMFSERGMDFSQSQVHKLNHARNVEGKTIHAADGYHWNNEGHRIVAESLIPVIMAELNKIEVVGQ